MLSLFKDPFCIAACFKVSQANGSDITANVVIVHCCSITPGGCFADQLRFLRLVLQGLTKTAATNLTILRVQPWDARLCLRLTTKWTRHLLTFNAVIIGTPPVNLSVCHI
jgi:hypothetical protein